MTYQHPIASLTPGVAPARQIFKRTFTDAELHDLNTDGPIELIGAPGAGKAIIIDELVYSYRPGETPTAFGDGGNVDIDAGTTRVLRSTSASLGLTGTTALTRFVTFAANGVTVVPNAAINIEVASALSAGDGTLGVTIVYHVLEV